MRPESPTYDSKINQLAAKLAFDRQEFKELSRVVFLVLKKEQQV
jgi:hypothetical protein